MKTAMTAILLVMASAGSAETLRDLCPERPGRGAPPCILDAGHIQYEAGLTDWTIDQSHGSRTDTLLIADSLVRFGVTDDTEAQIGWTPYGHVRTREPGGAVDRGGGTGDITFAVRHSLRNPDGKDLSIAIEPFATLPTGGHAIGATSWSAGVIVPLSVELLGHLQFAASPEIDAAADEERKGRHLAYAMAASLTAPIGKSGVNASVELWGQRDNDPSDHTTQFSADFSAAWQPKQLANLQLDVGTNIGLNRSTLDLEFYSGIAIRF